MTDDDRIMLDEIPLVIAAEYHNEGLGGEVHLYAGADPFILFRMKQEGGAVVCDITASMISGEDELIETLEVFFETLQAERARRSMIEVIQGEVIGDAPNIQIVEADRG